VQDLDTVAPQAPAAGRHEQDWRALVDQYLPVVPGKSGWRYCPPQVAHPAQGWKLHISATLPNAIDVFRRCAPLLAARGVAFKSVKTLNILGRLNSAIPFGFSQIGKFITVYPRDAAQAVELAELLDQATQGLGAPAVPFDRQLRPGSAVFFRYGAFGHEEVETDEGTRVSAVRMPSGELVPDLREPGKAVPDWIEYPLKWRRRPRRCRPAFSATKRSCSAARAASTARWTSTARRRGCAW